MENIQVLKFSKKAFQYYKDNVKNNENISKDQAARKMTRNMLLAFKFESNGYRNQMYQYGNLRFAVSQTGVIVWVRNHCKPIKGWKRNSSEYVRLNKELGIEDSSTVASLAVKDVRHKAKRLFWKIKNKKKVG